MKEVIITEGAYKGRRATVLAEGTFETFGRKRTGIKADAGLAGPLVLEPGEYEQAEPIVRTEIDDRYFTIEI